MNHDDRRIAGFVSQVLVLGAMPAPQEVVLLQVERPVSNGTRIGDPVGSPVGHRRIVRLPGLAGTPAGITLNLRDAP